jgi:hypothetical protein
MSTKKTATRRRRSTGTESTEIGTFVRRIRVRKPQKIVHKRPAKPKPPTSGGGG